MIVGLVATKIDLILLTQDTREPWYCGDIMVPVKAS